MSDSTPPKPSGITIPSWLLGILVSVGLATASTSVATAYKVGVAAQQVSDAATRVTAVEARVNAMVDMNARLAVTEAGVQDLRHRLEVIEARAPH